MGYRCRCRVSKEVPPVTWDMRVWPPASWRALASGVSQRRGCLVLCTSLDGLVQLALGLSVLLCSG